MWTPDGQRLVFIVSGDRGDAVYWRRADGSGEAEHLIDTRAAEGWNAGASQMRFLTLKETAGNRDYGIALLDIASRSVALLRSRPSDVPAPSERQRPVVARRADAAADQRIRAGRVPAPVRPHAQWAVPDALSNSGPMKMPTGAPEP